MLLVYALGLLLYGSLFLTALLSTLSRAVRYQRMNWRAPRLLLRDIALLGGHGASILIALLIRYLGFPDDLITGATPWLLEGLILTPAIVGIGVYVYYELFVIERWTPPVSADLTLPPTTEAPPTTYILTTTEDRVEAS